MDQSMLGDLSPSAGDHNSSSESPEIHTFYRVSGSLALLSFIGSLFVIITFITIKDLRKHPTRMIFFLSICDVMFSLKYLITAVLPHSDSFQNRQIACFLQAGIQQFFGLASIGWSGMISLNLIISTSRPFENTSSYSKFYHIWIWGFSLVSSIVMFSNHHNVIGPSGDGTCWIQIDNTHNKPFLLLFFIPLLAYFSISISSLVIAAISTRNRHSLSTGTNSSWSDRNRTGMLLRMSTYTLVFILCWSGPLAHRIAKFAGHSDIANQTDFLMFLDAIGVSIQGFMNALVWITNPSILRGFLDNIIKYLPFTKKFIEHGENTPLIRSLQDENQDPTQLAFILRNNILTCSLRGIALSVNDNLNHSLSSSLMQHQQQNNGNGTTVIQHLSHEMLQQKSAGGSGSISSTTPINDGSGELNGNSSTSNKNYNDLLDSNSFKIYTEKELFADIFSIAPNSTHIGNHKFKDYCPGIFAKIRELNGITPSDYLKSFDSSLFFENLSNQKFSEGKSGSFMCFSPDNKFLIKTITRQESILLKKKINKFYQYLVKNNSSFLLKFYGCHRISMPNDHTIYLAIMSNVFGTIPSGIKVRERYDLKGSKVNRGGSDPNFKGNGLGLDMDFLNYRKLLNLPDGLSIPIVQQLKRDAEFLQSLEIMDYSLLIGVVPNNDEYKEKLNQDKSLRNSNDGSGSGGSISGGSGLLLKGSFNNNSITSSSDYNFSNGIVSADDKYIYFIGVIDILQLYDFSKKLERFLKVYIVRKDRDGISAIPPHPYKLRFMTRMNEIMKNNNNNSSYNFNNNNNNSNKNQNNNNNNNYREEELF